MFCNFFFQLNLNQSYTGPLSPFITGGYVILRCKSNLVRPVQLRLMSSRCSCSSSDSDAAPFPQKKTFKNRIAANLIT